MICNKPWATHLISKKINNNYNSIRKIKRLGMFRKIKKIICSNSNNNNNNKTLIIHMIILTSIKWTSNNKTINLKIDDFFKNLKDY